MKALLLAAVLAAGDAPFVDADAGVYQVESASLPADAGTLGPGWYLTDAKMKHVGERIVAQDNRVKELEATTGAPTITYGFWVGLGLGVITTSVMAVLIAKELK